MSTVYSSFITADLTDAGATIRKVVDGTAEATIELDPTQVEFVRGQLRRTITTADDLAALPVYSVVLDADAIAYQHYGSWDPNNHDRIQWSAEGRWFDTEQITLPATVLYEPEAAK